MKPATSQKNARVYCQLYPVTYFKFKLVCEKHFWLSLQELQVVQNILKIVPMNNPTSSFTSPVFCIILFKNLKRSSLLAHRISLIFTFLYLLLYLWSRNRNSTEFLHEVNFLATHLSFHQPVSLHLRAANWLIEYMVAVILLNNILINY
uniref:Uncharacterized protein n=1 Tax=Glossina pallidipes TaxID=7398 RepID=A0A1A9ZQY7_GLOPL